MGRSQNPKNELLGSTYDKIYSDFPFPHYLFQRSGTLVM